MGGVSGSGESCTGVGGDEVMNASAKSIPASGVPSLVVGIKISNEESTVIKSK